MQHFSYVIIGAGVCGLAAASVLSPQHTKIIEKSRGPGGRLSSKRLGERRADIGAQFITVRDPIFTEVMNRAEIAGAVARWTPVMARLTPEGLVASPDRHPRYVGAPYMNAFGRFLAKDHAITTETRVASIHADPKGYRLVTTDAEVFSATNVIVTAPVNQMQTLLADFDVSMIATGFTMEPTWTVVIESNDTPCTLDGSAIDACFGGDDSVIDFVSREGSKPGRAEGLWVIHSTPEFAATHLEREPDEIGPIIAHHVKQQLGLNGQIVLTHRWRFARPTNPELTAQKGVYQIDQGLWIAGDYLSGGRVEGAYLAGVEVAHRALETSVD